jgi:hypothetical protein
MIRFLGLIVAVDDARLMRVMQAVAELLHQLQGRVQWKPLTVSMTASTVCPWTNSMTMKGCL